MNNFDFINDENYKDILIRDYNEICLAIEHKAIKSAAILSGSIIESLLTDFLINKDITKIEKTSNDNEKIKKKNSNEYDYINVKVAGLNNLINFAYNNKYISFQSYHLMHCLRDYRNYIHPDKEIRSNSNIKVENIGLFKNIINTILDEISKQTEDNFGFNSLRLLDYILRNDDSADVYLHILNRARTENDKIELFNRLIPKKINELTVEYNQGSYDSYDIDEHDYNNLKSIQDVIEKLYDCHRITYQQINNEGKKEFCHLLMKVITQQDNITKEIFANLLDLDVIDILSNDDSLLVIDFYLSYLYKIKVKSLFYNLPKLISIVDINKINKISDIITYYLKSDHYDTDQDTVYTLDSIKQAHSDKYDILIKVLKDIITNDTGTRPSRMTFRIMNMLRILCEEIPERTPF